MSESLQALNELGSLLALKINGSPLYSNEIVFEPLPVTRVL